MKRVAILVTGTRVPSAALEEEIRSTLGPRYFTSDYRVTLLHGNAPGADTVADAYARRCGWDVHPLSYFGDLGKRGGPERNRCLVAILCVLRTFGFACRVHAYPDDDSVGTRGCVEMASAEGFLPTVHEMGPRVKP
jgi:hypothetical protein